MRQIVVVGGGIAGLTAAYRLLEHGQGKLAVTVLEAEAVPGGQARAFTVDGVTVEHGSHAFFGYYRTIIDLIAELRARPELAARMPALAPVPGWTLVDPYGRRALLRQSPGLPRILSVVPSVMAVPWFTLGDKLRLLAAAYRLIRTPLSQFGELDRLTSYQLARKLGYSEVGALTWNSASLGLTNLFVTEQSGAIFAGKHKVLMGTPAGLSYQLPAGNLSELIANPLAARIAQLGGQVVTAAEVRELARPPGAARTTVRSRVAGTDRQDEADHVVLALQPWHAAPLTPWVKQPWTALGPVTPVITVVLALSGRIQHSEDNRELGLSREHWVFSVVTDLSRFWPEFAGQRTILRAEIGHADRLPMGADTPDELILPMLKRDLDRLFPEAAPMTIEWAKMHRESRHLYVSWTRGEFVKKPTERDLGQGIFLAGDWTSKGTIGMEAAANSGVEAANHVLVAEGLPPVPYTDVPL